MFIPNEIQKWGSFEAGAPQFDQALAGREAAPYLNNRGDGTGSKSGDSGFKNSPFLSFVRFSNRADVKWFFSFH